MERGRDPRHRPVIDLTALAMRRRVTAAAAKRRPARVAPDVQPPTGIAVTYAAALRKVAGALHDATVAAIAAEGVRLDAQGEAPSFDLTSAAIERVKKRVRAESKKLAANRSLVASIRTVSQRVIQRSREQWTAQVRAAIGVDLSGDIDLTKRAEGFERANLDLITSLGSDHVDRVAKVLREGRGERVETITARIREATGATESRAALIARDQVLSLNAEVTEERHKAAGVTEYVWRTSRDERVREDHRVLDGTRQKYSDPPIVDRRKGSRGNPGTWFQCRCTASPIIPGFDD